MLKPTLAVVIAFVLWSVGWLLYNVILTKLSVVPADKTQPISALTPLLALLIGSFLVSTVAGYVAAWIASTSSHLPIFILGVLLLGVGIFAQAQFWHLLPVWYHLTFLGWLIPFCFLGAWLRQVSAS